MKKIKINLEGPHRFILSDTGAIVMFTMMAVLVVQGAIFNAMLGNWGEVIDHIVLGAFVVALIMAHRAIKAGGKLIRLQQNIINSQAARIEEIEGKPTQ